MSFSNKNNHTSLFITYRERTNEHENVFYLFELTMYPYSLKKQPHTLKINKYKFYEMFFRVK